MERFFNSNASDIDFLREKSNSQNTVRSTNNWLRVYQSWAKVRGYNEQMETYQPNDLDVILQIFYTEVRKLNGTEYEPDSLKVMLGSLDRHLKSFKYPKSLLNDIEFMLSRKVLDGKLRKLREQGLGKKTNKAYSLTPEEEETLWKYGQLGDRTPRSLVNTIWWIVVQHFGLRGRELHHQLEISEFAIQTDEKYRKYIQFNEGPSKTRQGGLNFKPRQIYPRMYETGGGRCPLRFFETYVSKRPNLNRNTGPLYLAPIDNPKNDDIWYKNMRIGVHTINNIMKNMVINSPLADSNKKMTNHSARKTIVSKLRAAGFAKCEIKNITGHRNVEGLDPYDEGNSDQLQHMSSVISNDIVRVQNNNNNSSNSISTITSNSASSSVQQNQQINVENRSSSVTSSFLSCRPLPPTNFSFGIPWIDQDENKKIKHHQHNHNYHGKVYVLNNCSKVTINGENQPTRKRIRVIYSSDEEQD